MMARLAGGARWVRRWWAPNPVAGVALGIFVTVVALGALVAVWAVGEVRAIAHGEAIRDAQVMAADLLARHADRRAAIEIGARLAESVREGFQEYGIRLSVGVAGLPEDKGAVGDLFALAEQRLFAAKGQALPQPGGRG